MHIIIDKPNLFINSKHRKLYHTHNIFNIYKRLIKLSMNITFMSGI